MISFGDADGFDAWLTDDSSGPTSLLSEPAVAFNAIVLSMVDDLGDTDSSPRDRPSTTSDHESAPLPRLAA